MGRNKERTPWNVGRIIRSAWATTTSSAAARISFCSYHLVWLSNSSSGNLHHHHPVVLSAGENGITDAVFERLDRQRKGFFVEMGANDGLNSNSLKLERSYGWKGLCIEAGPTNFAQLQRNRPNCVNVQAVVADRSDQTITFREFPTGPLYGHSGLLNTRSASEWQDLLAAHPTAATLYRDHEVQTDTLAHILADHDVVPPLDYFSLDVEGAELLILRHYPFDTYPVRLWSIESNKLDRTELVSFMASQRYRCDHHDAINTICQLIQP